MKKIISVIISAIMLFCMPVISFAAEAKGVAEFENGLVEKYGDKVVPAVGNTTKSMAFLPEGKIVAAVLICVVIFVIYACCQYEKSIPKQSNHKNPNKKKK